MNHDTCREEARVQLSLYQKETQEVFQKVQDGLDSLEEFFDYDFGQNKLVIHIEGLRQPVVLNTQQAAWQLWLAGEGRAWHFDFDSDTGQWRDSKTQTEFYATLADLLQRLSGQDIPF
jgi:CyaY protein